MICLDSPKANQDKKMTTQYPFLKDYPHMFDDIDTAKLDREIAAQQLDMHKRLAAKMAALKPYVCKNMEARMVSLAALGMDGCNPNRDPNRDVSLPDVRLARHDLNDQAWAKYVSCTACNLCGKVTNEAFDLFTCAVCGVTSSAKAGMQGSYFRCSCGHLFLKRYPICVNYDY